MESSDDQETAPRAAVTPDIANEGSSVQAASETEATAASAATPLSNSTQQESAETADSWYPVVGATAPVESAVEPVPGSASSIAASEAPVATPQSQPPAIEGPFWPEASPASGAPAAEALEA